MAEVLSLGSSLYVKEIREKLNFRIEYLSAEEIEIKIEERERDNFIFFDYTLDESVNDRQSKDIFKDFLADSLADIIINQVESFLIEGLMSKKYKNYSQTEQKVIYNLVLEGFSSLENYAREGINSPIIRKRRIRLKLKEYLELNKELILEGFIRFRLQDYLQELELRIDLAVDYFIKEKEYQEFINLLRYFVEIQDTKLNLVHIINDQKSGAQILDQDYQVLSNEYLELLNGKLVEDKLDYNDLLISALLTVLPKRITLHCKLEHSTIKIVESIFGNRVDFCSGCEYCGEDFSIKN